MLKYFRRYQRPTKINLYEYLTHERFSHTDLWYINVQQIQNVTGSAKTVLNGTISISRKTVLKYCNNCVALLLHYSLARLAV